MASRPGSASVSSTVASSSCSERDHLGHREVGRGPDHALGLGRAAWGSGPVAGGDLGEAHRAVGAGQAPRGQVRDEPVGELGRPARGELLELGRRRWRVGTGAAHRQGRGRRARRRQRLPSRRHRGEDGVREPNDVTPCDAAEITQLGRHGRRDRRRIRRRRVDRRLQRRGRRGRGAGDRADRWARGGRRAGRGHRLPRRGHADPDGLRVRGQPRRHVPLHDGGLRPRSRRGQDRPLLRGEPGPFRLAGGRGRPVRPDLLRRHLHGPDRHRGPRVLGRRGRLPVQRDRPPRPAGPPGQDEAVDGVAAHAAPGGGRHGGGCGGLGRHPGRPPRAATTAGSSGCRRSVSARRCRCGPAAGVVLTAGGFIFNDDMLRQHCPPLARGTFKVGTEGDDGRGIRMAQAIGASVRNMYAGEVSLPITPPADPDPRHPRQRQGSALHQRGHLHGPGGPVGALRAGRRGLPASSTRPPTR